MIPATPVGSHMAVWEISEPKNKQIGWLTTEGTVTLEITNAIPYDDENILAAQTVYYSQNQGSQTFLWPAKA